MVRQNDRRLCNAFADSGNDNLERTYRFGNRRYVLHHPQERVGDDHFVLRQRAEQLADLPLVYERQCQKDELFMTLGHFIFVLLAAGITLAVWVNT